MRRPVSLAGLARWWPFSARQTGIAALVAIASFASAMLYLTYGRPPSGHSEVVLTRVAPAVSTASMSDSQAAVQSSTQPAGATQAQVGASPTREPGAAPAAGARPATSDLLRPGAQAIDRFDVSLDGSTSGQVALSSRYTVTSGCQPVYADVYALRDSRWQRVFDASDTTMQYGPLLSSPESTPAGCFPKLRIFAAETPPGGSTATLLIAAAYADTSARLVVLGWDQGAGALAALFDWRTGQNGTAFRSAFGDTVELAEDVPLPDAGGSLGRFTQTVTIAASGVAVTARRLSPNCDRGHIGGTGAGGTVPERVTIDCTSGVHVAATLAEPLTLTPDGIAWAHIREGDNIQVVYDPDSLQPDSLAGALPRIASLNDFTANTRKSQDQRAARTQTVPTQKPAAAPRAPATGVSQPRANPGSAGVAPAATRAPFTRAPTNPPTAAVPLIVPSAPAPVVSPPPAPRGPPLSAPTPPR